MIALKDVLLCLAVVCIWGVSFTVVKIGLDELPPLLFIACRFFVAAVPAIFFIPFPRTSIWNVVAIGTFLGIIKFGLLFVAMRQDASAGTASLLLQAQIFFTIFLSYLIFDEKVRLGQLTGIVFAVLGFLSFFLSIGGNVSNFGLMLLLGAALAWAIANIIMKGMMGVNLLHLMIWASLVPIVPMLVASHFLENSTPVSLILTLSPEGWASIIYMGYLATVVAYAIWGWLLRQYSSATVSPFALLIPIVGIVISSIYLDEIFSRWEMIGMLLVITGLVICVVDEKILSIYKLARIRFVRFRYKG